MHKKKGPVQGHWTGHFAKGKEHNSNDFNGIPINIVPLAGKM